MLLHLREALVLRMRLVLWVLGMLWVLGELGVLLMLRVLGMLLVLCMLGVLMLGVLILLGMLGVLLLYMLLRMLDMLGMLLVLRVLRMLWVLLRLHLWVMLRMLGVLWMLLRRALLLLTHQRAVALLNLVAHRLLVERLGEVVHVRLLQLARPRHRRGHLWRRRTGSGILEAGDLQRWRSRAGEDVVGVRRCGLLGRMECLILAGVGEVCRRRLIRRGPLLLRVGAAQAVNTAKGQSVGHGARQGMTRAGFSNATTAATTTGWKRERKSGVDKPGGDAKDETKGKRATAPE